MATKSLYKTVNLNSDNAVERFIDALDKSKKTHTIEVRLTSQCTDITGNKIKDFFKC